MAALRFPTYVVVCAVRVCVANDSIRYRIAIAIAVAVAIAITVTIAVTVLGMKVQAVVCGRLQVP